MKALDLCIKPRRLQDVRDIARVAGILGYKGFAVELDGAGVDFREVYNAGKEYGVEVYRRATIQAKSKAEMLKKVASVEKKVDVIAVESKTADVIRHAARDSRVDLVSLSTFQARYMDRSQADLLRIGGGAIEVKLKEFIEAIETGDVRRVRGFEAIVRRATAFRAPFVVSTCASNKWETASTASIVSILVSLGIPLSIARITVYSSPIILLRRKSLHRHRFKGESSEGD